ncbi:Sine1 [Thalictrum thalictroides]|uniref:Sine1 n=1 Tax=Thalictrum thalictroides TaxID=46969 RepID=A0A7J6WGR8_THATH|nr:Sine1 [Thalictrum thalictroides]
MSASRFSDSASPIGVKGCAGGREVLMELDKDVYGQNPVTKSETNSLWDTSHCKCNSIPTFLAQVLDTKDCNKLYSEEDIDCLFEVLAEVHGPDIVSQVNYIMESIIKTLTSSIVLDPVQHACAKLVYGIATYGVHPVIAEGKKREIIYSLCKPLSDCLLGFQEGLVYGSALCLEALIDSANWRFVSDEIVNDICLKVAVALEEKPTQTSAHMGLTMALTKHNSLIVEPYARSLMRSALQILSAGIEEKDSQKQLSAIQMVNLLMKCVDPRSVFSELEIVIKEMEKCYADQIELVSSAAFEAMKTARMVIWAKGSKLEESGLLTDSDFYRRPDCKTKIVQGLEDRPLVSGSPDSQYIYSSFECDFSAETSVSRRHLSCKFDYSGTSVKRKLWKEVDGSHTNGFHSYVDLGSNGSKTDSNILYDGETKVNRVDDVVFSGHMHAPPRQEVNASTTHISERPQSPLGVDDVKFFKTQREYLHSLQDPISKVWKKQARRTKWPSSNQNFKVSIDRNSEIWEHDIDSKSISSSRDGAANMDSNVSHSEDYAVSECHRSKIKALFKVGLSVFSGLSIILLVVMLSFMWIDYQETGINAFLT